MVTYTANKITIRCRNLQDTTKCRPVSSRDLISRLQNKDTLVSMVKCRQDIQAWLQMVRKLQMSKRSTMKRTRSSIRTPVSIRRTKRMKTKWTDLTMMSNRLNLPRKHLVDALKTCLGSRHQKEMVQIQKTGRKILERALKGTFLVIMCNSRIQLKKRQITECGIKTNFSHPRNELFTKAAMRRRISYRRSMTTKTSSMMATRWEELPGPCWTKTLQRSVKFKKVALTERSKRLQPKSNYKHSRQSRSPTRGPQRQVHWRVKHRRSKPR